MRCWTSWVTPAMWRYAFDAILHVDETHAVELLERTAGWEKGEPPETFPTAI
jgi:hypothetical protein